MPTICYPQFVTSQRDLKGRPCRQLLRSSGHRGASSQLVWDGSMSNAPSSEKLWPYRREPVLVRGFGGEPVRLIAVGESKRVIYVANPTSLERLDAGETGPVGVPDEDVFVFDEDAYRALLAKWDERGCLEREEWREFSLALFRS